MLGVTPVADRTCGVTIILFSCHCCLIGIVFVIFVVKNNFKGAVISGFRRDVDEICALLGYYAASCGNPLPTFRYNVSVPSSRVKKYFLIGFLDP